MHQAATPSNEESVETSAKIDIEQHKFARKIVSLIIVVSAVIITLYVWGIIEQHPRTDDATARANVVGIAPRVTGQILKLNVQDNQAVKEGDVLFEIDPEDYRLILEKAKADLATLDRQIAPGSEAIVYLSSAPNQRFRGKVQGIGWAVKPEGEIDLPPSGVPYVKRELNWVRVAQRFPVRIEVENPDPNLFRMGASAVAIIDGPAPGK